MKWKSSDISIFSSILGGIELVAATFVTSPSRTLLKEYPANDYCNGNRRRHFLLIGARKKKTYKIDYCSVGFADDRTQ